MYSSQYSSYGTLVLNHLLEYDHPGDTFSDGVPKEGIDCKEVLSRIAKMNLIRQKLFQSKSAPFNIDDGNCTPLHGHWNQWTIWKKQHDHQLLYGLLK